MKKRSRIIKSKETTIEIIERGGENGHDYVRVVSHPEATIEMRVRGVKKTVRPCHCERGLDTDGDGDCPQCAHKVKRLPDPHEFMRLLKETRNG